MSAADALLAVENLGIGYAQDGGRLDAVAGVSFHVARGEAFGLVGESGCGKSTLAYQLLGYRHPSARVTGGRVLFQGRDIVTLDRPALQALRGDRISLVPQNPTTALNPGMRVADQLAEVLLVHGRAADRAAARARAVELFAGVGLPQPERIARRYPHQLSGGQQQRVCIAIALACRPDLIVLDEPTTGLDVTTQEQIIDLLLALRADTGMAMVYVTHDLGVLAQIADRVGVMYAGRMVETGPTAQLFDDPKHPYTRGLIAAIPRLDGTAMPTGQRLRGYLRRNELPPGCPFQPRCDAAEPACAAEVQVLAPAAPAREVACRRWRALPPFAPERGEAAAAAVRDRAGPVVEVEGLTLRYGPQGRLARLFNRPGPVVVQGASFTIQEGETFALVGESGSGKSTIARGLSGLLSPAEGRIAFRGRTLAVRVQDRPRDLKRRIQYVFQNPDASLNPRATVAAMLGRPLEIFFGLSGRAREERIVAALREVRLDADYARRYPDQLSGGERQRVAIARAVVAQPELMLCDEVLSALDVSVQANVLDLLRALKRETGVAMLFISHDLAVVRALADRVGVLYRGALCEIGPVEAVFRPPYHPYTHELLMAVPDAHRRRTAARVRREPVPAGGAGCPYAGRCAWQAGEICEREPPPWRDAPGGLRIRCHHGLDELARRAVWKGGGENLPAAS